MRGWWCVRFGDALAWVEAPSEASAVWRSLDLHPLPEQAMSWSFHALGRLSAATSTREYCFICQASQSGLMRVARGQPETTTG